MGIISYSVTFDAMAPRLTLVGERVSHLTGLAVSVVDADAAEATRAQDARFHFAFDAGYTISVYTYRPGAIAEFCERALGRMVPIIGRSVDGMSEPAGSQAVFVRGYVGQEPTLLLATVIALETLGGTADPPLADADRDQYGRRITEAELRRRRRRLGWRVGAFSALGVAAIILSSPYWISRALIDVPARIWRARKIVRSLGGSGRSE